MTATFMRLIARCARRVRAAISASLIAIALAGVPAGGRAAQPPTTAAQDGFVPVDESKPQEQLPATPLVMIAYAVRLGGGPWLCLVDLVPARESRARDCGGQPARRRGRAALMGQMTAAHFIFIPSVLLIGMVIGWVLGSRAARDAYAAELRKREERERDAAPSDRERIASRDASGLPPAGSRGSRAGRRR